MNAVPRKVHWMQAQVNSRKALWMQSQVNSSKVHCMQSQVNSSKHVSIYIYILVSILGNMHLVTIYMERRLRRRTVTVMENVVKHKSSRYSGRIDFNKCPEILFSELKKGLVGTLFENICQFLSQKNAYKFRSKKLQKPRNRKSQRAKSMSSTYLQHVLHWLYFITSFSSEIACYRKMILLQNIYFYLRSHWEKFHFSFIVLTFCSKGHILLQVPHANFCTFLNNIWTFLLPPVSNSRKFEKLSHISWRILDALLMHFWCTFPFFTFY